jgi:neopullulanase
MTLRVARLGVAALALAGTVYAEAPTVTRVEPPSWWPGHALASVRLLVSGEHLAGARVFGAPGLGVGEVRSNEAGTHLFVDLAIDPRAAPGRRTLHVTTPNGRAPLPFELLAPLPGEGRFAGVGPDDVVYLVMPDRFADGDKGNDDPAKSRGLLDRGRPRYYHGGDLQGVIDRLPYIKSLGATAVWLNPWYDNADRLNERERHDGAPITDYHGYGTVDFYAVEERLGDLLKLRELVDRAHALGLKVVQDQVANHTGPYHPWLLDPPTPTWFNGTAARHLDCTWQTWTLADPHATYPMQRETLEGWFLNLLPDLNQDDPEVTRYIVQNALWWVDVTGLDAIRQDTLPYVHRRFWRDWMAALKGVHSSLTVVGEMFDRDPALVSFFQGGAARFDGIDSGIDTLFDFPLYYAIRSAFGEGKSIRAVAQSLGHDPLYPHPERLWTFLGLHDVARFMNENGATSEGLRLAFTFLLTARGTPLIYYGDEIGLPGGADPDNRRDFPGGFPGDAADAFTRAGRTPEQSGIWDTVQRLATLRRDSPVLRRGVTVHLLVSDQAYAYARVLEGESVVIVLNNDARPVTLQIPLDGTPFTEGAALEDRLGSAPEVRVEGGRLGVALPARSAAIYAMRTLSK